MGKRRGPLRRSLAESQVGTKRVQESVRIMTRQRPALSQPETKEIVSRSFGCRVHRPSAPLSEARATLPTEELSKRFY